MRKILQRNLIVFVMIFCFFGAEKVSAQGTRVDNNEQFAEQINANVYGKNEDFYLEINKNLYDQWTAELQPEPGYALNMMEVANVYVYHMYDGQVNTTPMYGGDYLYSSFSNMMQDWNMTGNETENYYEVRFQTTPFGVPSAYRLTTAQEAELTGQIEALFAGGPLSGCIGQPTADQVKACMNFVTSNATNTADFNRYDGYYHTAYAALNNHQATCEGSALLLYRLLRQLGIENRILMGVDAGAHTYNLVLVDGSYYYCDASTGATLKGSNNFPTAPLQEVYASSRYQNFLAGRIAANDYVAGLPPVVTVEGKQVMYRLYNPNSGEHFYTADSNERNNLIVAGWNYEGVGWYAPSTGDPVYRVYNANAGDHHYTMSAAEKDSLVQVGWSYEGVGFYSDSNQAVPLYRAYNPNAQAGSHNYTSNKSENDFLRDNGWQDEGIAWYGIN